MRLRESHTNNIKATEKLNSITKSGMVAQFLQQKLTINLGNDPIMKTFTEKAQKHINDTLHEVSLRLQRDLIGIRSEANTALRIQLNEVPKEIGRAHV